MGRPFGVVLVLVAGTYALSKSNLPQQAHAHTFSTNTAQTLIDGSKHPELIPDSTAYRLFLITVAEPLNTTPDLRARQRAFLAAAGLSEGGREATIPILATFRARYMQLVDEYNKSVAKANAQGMAPDLQAFLKERDALVELTREQLTALLSADDMARFHAHIVHEKARMKIATEVQ